MPSQYVGLMYLILLVAIFYFMIVRPQQRRAREKRELIASLKVGDRIVTIGGIYGQIKAITDETVTLEIATNIRIKIRKEAVAARQR
jgi:preprotein translocase subunit YajC